VLNERPHRSTVFSPKRPGALPAGEPLLQPRNVALRRDVDRDIAEAAPLVYKPLLIEQR